MKVPVTFLIGFVFLSPVSFLCQMVPPGAAVPPGYGQPPPTIYSPSYPAHVTPTTADLATLQRDAKELLDLSQAVQPQIDSLRRGLLAKDLAGNLKRIEKLSKHLREEIAPLGN